MCCGIASQRISWRSGVDLRIIQVLLGHEHLSTTARYARVSTHLIASVRAPWTGCRWRRRRRDSAAVQRPALEFADVFRRHGGAYLVRITPRILAAANVASWARSRPAARRHWADMSSNATLAAGRASPTTAAGNRNCPKCQGTARAAWLCRPPSRTAAGSLFPCRLHLAAGGGRDRLSEQGARLCVADALAARRGDDRARRQTSSRQDRPASPCCTHGARRSRIIRMSIASFPAAVRLARRRALDRLQARLLPAREARSPALSAAHSSPDWKPPSTKARCASSASSPTSPHAAPSPLALAVSATRSIGSSTPSRPSAGPSQVLGYLARYTHRAAIANSRLVEITDDEVAFAYKDYRRNGRRKIMRLSAG